MTVDSPAPTPVARVAALSYFFPAHDEAENIEALVAEALVELPALAERFEIICVDDGSTDGTGAIADRLAAAHPDVVRVVHHAANQGYGAAVRSGLRAARYPLICFTDGDRQFRVADLGRLLARLDEPSVRGDRGRGGRLSHRARRPAHPARLRTHLPGLPAPLLRARRPRPRLRLQALPPRSPRAACAWSRAAPSSRPSCSSRSASAAAHRRDGRAALPADGGPRVGCGPARRGSRGARLLGAAPAALGEPRGGLATRCARHGERRPPEAHGALDAVDGLR